MTAPSPRAPLRRLLSLAVPLVATACAAGAPAPDRAPASRPAGDGALTAGFLLLDGVYGSELVAPHDVLQHTVFHVQPGMRVLTVGRTREAVTSFEGLRIVPDHDLDSAPPLDVLVVPSAEHNMDSDLDDARLVAWIAERGRAARHVVSLCDGAFLLAQAGLLDGRRCTTFPGDVAAFRKRFPRLDVVEGVSFVADGPAITGAGGARSYDPAMYLVESLWGKGAAEGIGRGLVIDWQLERVAHEIVAGPVAATARPACWLPGDRIDGGVVVEDGAGRAVTLREAASGDGVRAVVLVVIAGAEGIDAKQRGGLWCEDSYSELPLLRHLILDYAPRGVRFVAVACPPVYHEAQFGYAEGAFLQRAAGDDVYESSRRRFVDRTLALRARDALPPFDAILFDPRLRLLSNPARGEASPATGPRPPWQGRFKWHADTQTYGTPTIWVLGPDLEVVGDPFFMNVWESEGRAIRFTPRDVRARLDRLLPVR